MASKKGSIPGPDPGFHGFIGPFSDYVSANAAALKADPDDVTALTTAVTTWKTAYPAHTAAHSAATGARNVKDQSRADVEAVARPLIQQFQASTTVTDAQRSAMNINIHATTRTPAAVPTTRPIVTVGTKFRHRFRPRPHLQFFVNAADVGVDGLVADAEFVRDFLVHQSLAQQVEHLLFALGKVFGGAPPPPAAGRIARPCARCAWSSASRRAALRWMASSNSLLAVRLSM
jgi:hypothetical protein